MKRDVVNRLMKLPSEIARAERELLKMDEDYRWYKSDLQKREDELLNSGAIDGKNEAIRAAQLRSFTLQHREELAGAEITLLKAQCELRILRAELETLRAVADLLRGDDAA